MSFLDTIRGVISRRVFPGIFSRSIFEVDEAGGRVAVRIIRRDGCEEVAFAGRPVNHLPESSLFPSMDEAAGFFSLGATGYSATRRAGHDHGMDLKCLTWSIEPMDVEYARSCFFGDTARFPPVPSNSTARFSCETSITSGTAVRTCIYRVRGSA